MAVFAQKRLRELIQEGGHRSSPKIPAAADVRHQNIRMSHQKFPVHLRIADGNSVYRIHSETAFLEVQRVGRRFVAHDIVARTWPERLRIADLLENADGTLTTISATEFEDWLGRALGR